MTTPNIANLLRVPGRLSHSPTSLSTAWPHGGTGLGTCGRKDLLPLASAGGPLEITAEEYGGAVVDLVYTGESWRFESTLREYDAAALAILFPVYAAGAAGGPILEADANSSVRAGSMLGDLAKVLLFTPDNLDQHPWMIARRAVPQIRETARLALRANSSFEIPVVWHLTPDTNAKQFSIGLRRNLTL